MSHRLEIQFSSVPHTKQRKESDNIQFQPEHPIEEQIHSPLPHMGLDFGKSSGRFTDCHPLDERSEVNDTLNLSTGKTEDFYQFCDTIVVQYSAFLSRSRWIIPFDIASFQGELPT